MYCIYHSIDLDGWCSAAIVKMKFPEVKLIGYNYGDEIPDLSFEDIIMVDISLPKEIMIENMRLTWIDHHISAIKEMGEGGTQIAGIRDTKFAACELTWKYFFPKEPIPEFVRLLGRYDCFGHKDTDEEQKVLEFQYAARAYYKNPDDCYKMITKNNDTMYPVWYDIDWLLQSGKSIYKYLCTEAKQTYKNGFYFPFPEDINGITHTRKFICFNKERFNPINFGINYHNDGYDGAACFHFANGLWNFSLYNDNGEVDCSVIAKQFGGGGHKGAAGFRVKNLPYNLSELYDTLHQEDK